MLPSEILRQEIEENKFTDEEKAARSAAIQAATLYATEVPLRTMKAAFATFPLLRAMAQEGNPASVSDAGVGALAARSAGNEQNAEEFRNKHRKPVMLRGSWKDAVNNPRNNNILVPLR